MNIELKDLYQLLIAECRYGYTRNNHLMPEGAYDHVKQYLPLMIEEDKDFAIHTAQQLCEECISEELSQFEDGIDDENNSRQEAFKFIEWLLMFIDAHDDSVIKWNPYNYDIYLRNKSLDDEPLYNIYEGDYSTMLSEIPLEELGPTGEPINIEKISKNNTTKYLFETILNNYEGIYRKWGVDKYTIKYVFDDLERVFYIKREH